MTEEVWRPIVGWENLYEVSSSGRVRSLDRTVETPAPSDGRPGYTRHYKGRILRLAANAHGYHQVALCRDGIRSNARVHALVCEAFHGPRPEGHDVAHGDGCKVNNSAGNLRWATRSENMRDAICHGTIRHGERHHMTRLSDAQVRYVRSNPQAPRAHLAEALGVRVGLIDAIRGGCTWKYLKAASAA